MRDGKAILRATFLILSFICSLGLGSGWALGGEILEPGKSLYSLGNEERIIRHFFDDRRGGVFLDVGAADYRLWSTTYYLEEHLGWSGIAVDALGEFALGYIQHRPRTRFFNFLVTDQSWAIERFYRVPDPHLGLSSKNTSWLKFFGRSKPETKGTIKKKQVVYIMTITLTDLLEKNGVSKLDFLSMNIEGGELDALAGFDIERFRPEFVCVECLWKKAKLLDYFSAYGYEPVEEYREYDRKNCYFKPKK